jgi:hypothetical protein
MNWHEPTQEETDGTGDCRFLVDIQPDIIPHQAATDGDALFRVSRPGWTWMIRVFEYDKKKNKHMRAAPFETGDSETKPAAIADAQAALARLRATL